MHRRGFASYQSVGKRLRLGRLANAASGRSLIVPMDHSLSIGALGPAHHTEQVIGELAAAGVDAVVLHKGRIRTVDPLLFRDLGLIVHLSGGTDLSPDTHVKVLVGGVEEALRQGADAISVHVNVGATTDSQQLTDLGAVGAECERLGVPLLAMMYARGPVFEAGGARAGTATDPQVLAHLAAIAVDLGADMVKLVWPGNAAAMHEVVATCPIPVYVAGGSAREGLSELREFTEDVLASGASGLAIGRSVFAAAQPGQAARTLAELVHRTPGAPAPEASLGNAPLLPGVPAPRDGRRLTAYDITPAGSEHPV